MERDFLVRRFEEGASLEQLGRELGLHSSAIGYWAKKFGLEAPGANRFSARGAPDRHVLQELAAKGLSLKQIGNELDRSVATIRYWLRKWSIERRKEPPRVAPDGPRIIERHCGRHRLTRFGLEGRGYYRCLRCRQERVSEWRRRVKRILVEEAGGRCRICGYSQCTAALQFHHLDPTCKSFSLSDDGVARNVARARDEARKCTLLCANCHAEVESGYTSLDVSPP
jgi:hypothetical protein